MAASEDTDYPVIPTDAEPANDRQAETGSLVNFPGQGPAYTFESEEFERWYGASYIDHLRSYKKARRQGDQETAIHYLKLMIVDKEQRIRDERERADRIEQESMRRALFYPLAFIFLLVALWTATSIHFGRPVAPQEMFTVAGPPLPPPGAPHGPPPQP